MVASPTPLQKRLHRSWRASLPNLRTGEQGKRFWRFSPLRAKEERKTRTERSNSNILFKHGLVPNDT